MRVHLRAINVPESQRPRIRTDVQNLQAKTRPTEDTSFLDTINIFFRTMSSEIFLSTRQHLKMWFIEPIRF